MVIEDSRTSRSDIHVLCLDLVNALGSIDHGKTCITMLRLGCMDHMVTSIADLYKYTSIVVYTPL